VTVDYDEESKQVTIHYTANDCQYQRNDGWHKGDVIYGEWGHDDDKPCCGSFRLQRGGLSDGDVERLLAEQPVERCVDAVATQSIGKPVSRDDCRCSRPSTTYPLSLPRQAR